MYTPRSYHNNSTEFEFLQIYSRLEHLQRQINNITRQMNSNTNYDSTYWVPSRRHFRNHTPEAPSQTSNTNSNTTTNIPSTTHSNMNTNSTRPRTHISSSNVREPGFRSLLDNLFNLNDIRNLGAMEISVRNSTTDPSLFRDLLNTDREQQTRNTTTFRDIEDNTEIEVLNLDNHHDICVICREQFQNNEIIRRIKKCKHYFHLSCSNTWFNNNMTCPLCRQCIIIEDTEQNDNNNDNGNDNGNDNDNDNDNQNTI